MLPQRHLVAVTVMTDVALLARHRPVSARLLAERQGRAPRQLEALLQGLVRHGLLRGTRGPHGGYELARERRRITVGEIVRLVERDAPEDAAASPADLRVRVIGPALAAASAAFLDALDAITIEHLCRAAEQGEPEGLGPADAEFHI